MYMSKGKVFRYGVVFLVTLVCDYNKKTQHLLLEFCQCLKKLLLEQISVKFKCLQNGESDTKDLFSRSF